MSEPTGARRYGVGGGDAYYDAVRYGGYEGTREQFGKDQAEFAQNAAAVAEAKEAVEQDAEEVRSTKEEFVNTTVPNAIAAVQQEGADQVEAVTEKGEEVSQQVEAVGTQWKDEVANEGRSRVQAVEQAGTTQVQNVNDAGTTQVGNVNQAGEDQVDAVEQAGADQVQAVTNEGTTQVGNVTGEGNTQVQRVQDKGDEVLNSIPADYITLDQKVNNLKESTNDNLYRKTGNLLDFGFIGGTWEQGGIGNSNPYMCKTKPIPVSPGQTLYGVVNRSLMQETQALSTFTMSMYLHVFDVNDTAIVSSKNMGSSASQLTGSETMPEGASYAVIVLSTGAWGNQFTPNTLDNVTKTFAYFGTENIIFTEVLPNCIPYPEYNDTNIQNLENEVNLYNNTLVWIPDEEKTLTQEAGIVSSTGYVNTVSEEFVHYNVTVIAGQHYQVKSYEQRNTSYPFVLFYDSGNNIIGNIADGSSAYVTKEFVVPDNVTNMCVNGTNYVTTPTHVYTLKVTNTKEYIDEITSKNYWKGKKIVWFGTSIPAGVINSGDANGNGAYPTRIGKLLGATVYNESIGSSRIRGGNYHAISADDPMGWSGCEALGVMLSMSLSRAEKQSIINDWDSKWKNIMLQPSQYDASKVNTYLNSSWDTILTKYLAGGSVGQCDLYVFDHGYNDGIVTYGFSDLDEIPAQEDDRTYWWGAMNFLIGKILADNPKAKILIIGHYNYSSDPSNRGANWSGKYICDAQKAYAESWGMTCIETWKLLGLTMNTITVNGTATPIIYARYPDHIHPASDPTGYELKRYADALAPYFKLTCST